MIVSCNIWRLMQMQIKSLLEQLADDSKCRSETWSKANPQKNPGQDYKHGCRQQAHKLHSCPQAALQSGKCSLALILVPTWPFDACSTSSAPPPPLWWWGGKKSLLLPFEIKWHLVQKMLFRGSKTSQAHLISVSPTHFSSGSCLCLSSISFAHHHLTSHQLLFICHRLLTPSHVKFTRILHLWTEQKEMCSGLLIRDK